MKIDEEKWKRNTAEFSKQGQQLAKLEVIGKGLSTVLNDISPKTCTAETIKYLTQKVQYQYHLQRLDDINASLILCLKDGHVASVEALSRVSLESSVNLLYLLGEEKNERAMGVIQGYLKKNSYKARKWLEHAQAENNEQGIAKATQLLKSMELGSYIFQYGKECKPERWPDSIKKKFIAVDLEESYVTLFSSSSDAVHSGAEDIYNRTFVEHLDPSVKNQAAQGVIAERKSFAVYLTICSLMHSIESVLALCLKAEFDTYIKALQELHCELVELKYVHENHCVQIK
ncbi:hypothetical protein D6L39_24100 [Vibrio parahaemolyticus]|nr:hypothetical protein [Vibrio parahaemolyticus]EHR1203280.1 hypothetical protein [Vibrio parahaemolyticus]EHR5855667.1 hypothetical protein [Vibrio parahaemolyticus]EJG1881354.1 hypothetical protein [Vibrio parahaemolyticus]